MSRAAAIPCVSAANWCRNETLENDAKDTDAVLLLTDPNAAGLEAVVCYVPGVCAIVDLKSDPISTETTILHVVDP